MRHHGMNRVFRSSLLCQVFFELKTHVSLASAVGRIWICERTCIAVDESSRPRRCARERTRKCFWSRAWQARASEKNGLVSAQYPVELAESFLKAIREDLRGNEKLSNVAAFSAGPSQHVKIAWQRTLFVDDVRSGVLETERIKQARREEVQRSCGMCVWEPVLRKDMDAEGAKAVSLRWIGTDKGDAGRPSYRSRLVVRQTKKAMKKCDVPSAAELFSGMPLLEVVNALHSLFVSHSQEEAKGKRTLAMYDICRAHFHGVPVGEREARM